MAQGSYAAQVEAAIAKQRKLMKQVRDEAAERTIDIMQTERSRGGNLRFQTGFLRASLTIAPDGAFPPVTFKPPGVESFAYDPGPINLTIAGADIKDPITVVYTANYARPREYGARGQPGDRWVALAAQQWARTVDEVVAEVKTLTR